MPAPAKSRANASFRRKGANKPVKRYEQATVPKGPLNDTVTPKKIVDLPVEIQQLILNVFRDSFRDRFGDRLEELLQEVKGHLFDRDFKKAFGRDDYLEAYAVRWSPSRALGYMEILLETFKRMKERGGSTKQKEIKIACLGGGAGAEIVSLAAVLRTMLDEESSSGLQEEETQEEKDSVHFDVRLIDLANWSTIIEKLHKTVTTPPQVSKYASAAVKAANKAFIPASTFNTTFLQQDILVLKPQMYNLLVGCDLVTLFFTLNELYTASLPYTKSFLFNLTKYVKAGSFFLVVDSAGSYSTVALSGKEEKKYPMQWLLDHSLLDGDEGSKKWEKVKEEESRWFRIPEELVYKLELENMRCQIHLYCRTSVV